MQPQKRIHLLDELNSSANVEQTLCGESRFLKQDDPPAKTEGRRLHRLLTTTDPGDATCRRCLAKFVLKG
jgi:hypothetical protein